MVCELFFCQISWNSNDWIDRKRQVSAKAIGLNFSSNCACAAFNWVLSILKNPRIAGFFTSLPFLKYLCYERLMPSTHCVQLRRKIAKIERALSTKKWSLHQRHVCFYNPCARAESHQQERTKTVFGHLNCRIPCHLNQLPRSQLRGTQKIIKIKNSKWRSNVMGWLRGTPW